MVDVFGVLVFSGHESPLVGGFLAAMAAGDESAQALAEEVGVLAVLEGHQALQYHVLLVHLGEYALLVFAGDGQGDDVRYGQAVNRGHEGHGDAAPQLGGIVQVGHDVNQAQHGSDDSDSGGVRAHRFDHGDGDLGMLLESFQFGFHDAEEHGGIDAVHYQGQSLAGEGIGMGFGLGFQRHDAVLARELTQLGEFGDGLFMIRFGRGDHDLEGLDG